MKVEYVRRRLSFTTPLSAIGSVILAILGAGLAITLLGFSMWAVVIIERQMTLKIFGEEIGPTGLEYFIGPAFILLMFFGATKLHQIIPSKKQTDTVLDFRNRALDSLHQPIRDWDELDDLFKEGLTYQNRWEADRDLNEMVGVLRHFVSQHSAQEFIAKFEQPEKS